VNRTLRFLSLLALCIWVGGIFFFAAVLAPTLFRVLPTRELAGSVVNPSLRMLHVIGFICGGIVVVSYLLLRGVGNHMRQGIPGAAVFLVALMLALTAASQLLVTPKMDRLRSEMGAIDSVAATDARRVEFNRLHQWSTGLEAAVLLCGFAGLFSFSRE
jgi:hypothetical protein